MIHRRLEFAIWNEVNVVVAWQLEQFAVPVGM